LTPAELTNLSSLLSQQKVIGNVPESSVQMQKFYKEREAKVQSAVDDYLATISQVEDAAIAGNRGVAALEVQRQNLLKAREEAVDPIYKAAFASSVPVNTAPVLNQIDNMLKTQPPTGRAAGYLRCRTLSLRLIQCSRKILLVLWIRQFRQSYRQSKKTCYSRWARITLTTLLRTGSLRDYLSRLTSSMSALQAFH